jgi:serine/threonine protein kinase
MNSLESPDDFSFLLKRPIITFSKYKPIRDETANIGTGAYGQVLKFKNSVTGDIIALKMLNPGLANTGPLLALKREILMMSEIESDFILKILGFTTSAPYAIALPIAQNGCLFGHLHGGTVPKWLTNTRKTVLAMGIASGMAELHAKRIIHRDLKSNNVLIDDQYRPVICDFGTACFFDEVNTAPRTIGTIQWSAPEILGAQPYTEKVDVYSFGVLLYELLTEHIPFREVPPIQVVRLVKDRGKRPELPVDCPRPLAELIGECWTSLPEERPTFEAILPRFLSHEVAFCETDFEEFDRIFSNMLPPPAEISEVSIVEPSPPVDPAPQDPHEPPSFVEYVPQVRLEPPSFIKDSAQEARQESADALVERLTNLSQIVTALNCGTFFAAVVSGIDTHGPAPILPPLLSVLLRVVRIPGVCRAFGQTRIPEQLPIEDHPRRVMSILQEMVADDPNSLSAVLVGGVLSIFREQPELVVQLARTYAEQFPRATDPYVFLDGVLKHWRRSGLAQRALVELFQYLCLTYDVYREARLEFCGVIVYKIIVDSSDTSIINACYGFLCRLPGCVKDFNFEILSKHLRYIGTISAAINFFATIKLTSGGPKLVSRLLFAAERHPTAIKALRELLRVRDCVPLFFANLSFLGKGLPTFTDTFDLYRTIAVVTDRHSLLVQCEFLPTLFLNYLREHSLSHLALISTELLHLTEFPLDFLQRLDRIGFCTAFFNACSQSADPELIRPCLRVFRRFSAVGFLNAYLDFLPTIFNFIEDRGANMKGALFLLLSLAKFPECRPAIKRFKPDESRLPEDVRARIHAMKQSLRTPVVRSASPEMRSEWNPKRRAGSNDSPLAGARYADEKQRERDRERERAPRRAKAAQENIRVSRRPRASVEPQNGVLGSIRATAFY